jgi:hypothetical protein
MDAPLVYILRAEQDFLAWVYPDIFASVGEA